MFRTTLAALSLFAATLAGAEVTEQFTQTHPLSAHGNISLSNVNGDVEIVAWDRAEVRIEAVKFAKNSERLERISIEVDAQPDLITIKTMHPKLDHSWFGSWKGANHGGVRYKLHVPAALAQLKVDTMNANVTATGVRGDMKIDTMNGRIEARGLNGDINLDTMNGRIFASFDTIRSGQKISLDTMNGSCTVELPRDTGAQVRASTMNGRVKSDLPITIEKSTRRSLRGTLGQGGASIVLDSMNGSLTLRARS